MKSIELFKSDIIKTKYFNKVLNHKRIGFLYSVEAFNELCDIVNKYINERYEQNRT